MGSERCSMNVYQVGVIEANCAVCLLRSGIFDYRSGLSATGNADDIIGTGDRDHNILSGERTMLIIHLDGVGLSDAFTGG